MDISEKDHYLSKLVNIYKYPTDYYVSILAGKVVYRIQSKYIKTLKTVITTQIA